MTETLYYIFLIFSKYYISEKTNVYFYSMLEEEQTKCQHGFCYELKSSRETQSFLLGAYFITNNKPQIKIKGL